MTGFMRDWFVVVGGVLVLDFCGFDSCLEDKVRDKDNRVEECLSLLKNPVFLLSLCTLRQTH